MPKFYLFDVGVANHLAGKVISQLAGADADMALEHFVLMEIMAYRGLHEKDFAVSYWRTKSGLEVDFILGRGETAVEVKITSEVKLPMLKGLQAFVEEHQLQHAVVVSQDKALRNIETSAGVIHVLPWSVFLDRLWKGEYL